MQAARPTLLQTNDAGPLAGQAYLCWRGQRRVVMELDRLPAEAGLSYPEDVVVVPEKVLLAFDPGPRLPRPWTEADRAQPPAQMTSFLMRELIASNLKGVGLEIGALAAPAPVPLGCEVRYADFFDHDEIMAQFREQSAHNLVRPTLRTSYERLEGVADESQDFIIASHVIEHTRDPIGAILRSYRALKPGGKLVLTVPDKERTFDRHRPLTTLAHLIEDFHEPSRERDQPHFQEFAACLTPPADWRRLWDEEHPIHYHVWVCETFLELVDWIRANAAPFASVWSQRTLPHEVDDFEFYVVLTK